MPAGNGRSGAASRARARAPRSDAELALQRDGTEPSRHEREELREILITVSPSQFETFARDLKLLRQHGAESNTRAIIDAVRERAARINVGAVDERKAA
jgi:hypothetical protein